MKQDMVLCKIQEIRHAIKTYEDELKAKIKISLNEGLCLCAINEGFTEPSIIANKLDISPSGISRILDGMEKKGFIARVLGKEDRRNIQIKLTASGKKTLEKIHSSNIEFSLPAEVGYFIKNN